MSLSSSSSELDWTICKCLTTAATTVTNNNNNSNSNTEDETLTFGHGRQGASSTAAASDFEASGLEVLLQQEQQQWNADDRLTLISVQPEVSYDHLDVVLDWLCDVCCDAQCHPEIFSLASRLMFRFLTLCSVQACQLQLLSAACLVLASKVRSQRHPHCGVPLNQLVDYADASITCEEIKAWEKLVLSKLSWKVDLQLSQDFLSPMLLQLKTNEQLTTTPTSSNLKQNDGLPSTSDVVTHDPVRRIANLAASFAHRSSDIVARHPPRLVAAAAIIIAIKSCQSNAGGSTGEGVEADCPSAHSEMTSQDVFPPDLLKLLRLDEDQVHHCYDSIESLLVSDSAMKHQDQEQPLAGSQDCRTEMSQATPPASTNSSPFKISSSSTPKRSTRLPLRDGSNLPSTSTTFRRRLHRTVDSSFDEFDDDHFSTKENNDSAIGETSFVSPTVGLSPATSSTTSSAKSSPDSGASSVSPKSSNENEDSSVQSISKKLSQTSFSPLAETDPLKISNPTNSP